jgi:hypothetical protein
VSECQICARDIKDRQGVIAHHGYKRPGHGWQSSSCMGARHPSYAKSRDVIPRAIEQVQHWKEGREKYLVEVNAKAVPLHSRHSVKEFRKTYQPDDPYYPIRQGEVIRDIEWEIKRADKEITRLQQRYDSWKPIQEVTL